MASSTVTVSGWTSLGSGPMIIETNSNCGVWIIDAASQPAAGVLRGAIYLDAGKELPISPVGTLWALPGQGAATASVGVEPQSTGGLSIPTHDYIGLSYTGSNMTGVTYKTGGANGMTVATLTLGYDGSNNLTSVTRS